jgi:hypothetical protein
MKEGSMMIKRKSVALISVLFDDKVDMGVMR